jgi:hypothetical protein
MVDGERVGSVEMNNTIEIPIEPGRHALQVLSGRDSSGTRTFEAAEGEIVSYRGRAGPIGRRRVISMLLWLSRGEPRRR